MMTALVVRRVPSSRTIVCGAASSASAASPGSIDVHRPRDEQLGVEAQRLLPRLPTEVITGKPGREPEVVLDARRRPGLAAARDALDEQRATVPRTHHTPLPRAPRARRRR